MSSLNTRNRKSIRTRALSETDAKAASNSDLASDAKNLTQGTSTFDILLATLAPIGAGTLACVSYPMIRGQAVNFLSTNPVHEYVGYAVGQKVLTSPLAYNILHTYTDAMTQPAD